MLNPDDANSYTEDLDGNLFILDDNDNGEIEIEEAQMVTGLKVYGQNISDMTGLKYFTNLTWLTCSANQLTTLDVSALLQLESLYCPLNQLTSLDISALSNLKKLECSQNQLTALDLHNSPQLESLWCKQNMLESLDLSGLSLLEYLDCSENQLSSLNLGGVGTNTPIGFRELRCSSNALTSVDLSGLAELRLFDCSNNLLTALNLSGAIALYKISCSNNQLTTLDLSANHGVWEVDCMNNSSLAYLKLKNGRSQNPIYISGCPNLQYVCADDGNETTTIQNQIDQNGYTNCHVNSYCSFNPGDIYYVVAGNNSFDYDSDGCDPDDLAIPSMKLSISGGSTSGVTIADGSGQYSFPFSSGNYMLTPVLENPDYFTVSPASAQVSFPVTQSPYNQNFCLAANGVHPDLEISMLPTNRLRPGFDCDYQIRYKNNGTTTLSGNITLNFDDSVLDFVSSLPLVTSQNTNVLVLNFDNLAPFESRYLRVTFNANSPTDTPALNGGDVVNFTASILSPTTDETPQNNIFTLHQTAVNSFDPNDKTCLEGATITSEMVSKYVHYMIRFENTGTANAENIVVKDMIDADKFDVNSLIPLDGSHPFVTRINGNKVELIFENINLSFNDASNDGYVAFKIKTKSTLVSGDSFSNTASIYFDYNFPILTDPAVTSISVLANPDFEFDNYFRIYPNPAVGMLNIDSKQNITITSVSIYNALGQLVLIVPNAKGINTVDVSRLQTGSYFIKVDSDKGASNVKFIKK